MRRVFIAVPVCVLAFAALPGAAHAEGGLFGVIARMLSGGSAPPPPAAHSETDAPSTSLLDVFGLRRAEVKPAEGGPQVSYCVRTCDGRFFPMAKNGGSVTPAKMCQSMCPAADTEIFYGNTIENSFSQKGVKYSALANAFAYRDRLSDGCTCNGKNPAGNASIPYQDDPTLRSGDVVMTESGPVVFKGAIAPAHKLSDFVPVRDSNRISGTMREKVIAMKLMPTRQASVTARKLKPSPPATAAQAAAAISTEPKIPALGFSD